MQKQDILNEAAKTWFHNNPDGDPQFSINLAMPGAIFNDNDDADDFENAIVDAGEASGYFVEPKEIVEAYFAAKG